MKPILSRGVLLTLQSAGAGIVGVAALVALLALLSGCASTSAKAFSPEPGKQGYVIECGRHTSQCYEQAQKSCPSGFDVMNSSTAVTTGGLVPVGNTMVASTATNVTLVVSCKS